MAQYLMIGCAILIGAALISIVVGLIWASIFGKKNSQNIPDAMNEHRR